MRRIKRFIFAAALLSMLGSVICELSGNASWVKTASAAEICEDHSANNEKTVDEQVLVPEEKYWEYEEDENGEIRILSFNDYEDYMDPDYGGNNEKRQPYQLVIPQTIAGKKVTYVGSDMMSDDFLWTTRKITSIKVPEGVAYIGNLTDEWDNVRSVELPSTLKEVGSYAFYMCSNLQTIEIPEGVTCIGDWAFYECHNLQSIQLPDSLTKIGMFAFYECSSLKKIRIPAKVTDISEDAFQGCRAMEAFEVDPGNSSYVSENGILIHKWMEEVPVDDDEVDEDGDPVVQKVEKKYIVQYPAAKKGECYVEKNMGCSVFSFMNANGLTAINVDPEHPEYTSVDGVVYTKDMKRLIACPSGKSGEYMIPEGVYDVDEYAFSCSSLSAIHFPDSLFTKYITEAGDEENAYIDWRSFGGIKDLKTISVGENATEGGIEWLLNLLPHVENIIVPEQNKNICSVDNVVYDKQVKTLLGIGGTAQQLVLPDTVETSGKSVQDNKITELVLGKNYRVEVKTYYETEYEDENGNLVQEGPYTELTLPHLTSLQSYSVSEANTTLAAHDGLLYSKDMKTLHHCPSKKKGVVVVREGTVTIGKHCFDDYYPSDEEDAVILIPASVTDIQCDMDGDKTIKGYRGSAAEKYANEKGLTFIALEDGDITTTPPPAAPTNKPTAPPSVNPSPAPGGSTTSPIPGGTSTPKPTTDTPALKEDSTLTITAEGNLTGILQNKNTVQEIRQQFADSDLVIKDASGKQLTDSDLLGTGATVSVMDGAAVKTSCQVVLVGDINGDGKVNGKDVSMLARSLVGKATLTDVQKKAGEVFEDGKVNGKDVSKLAQSLVGKATIPSQGK